MKNFETLEVGKTYKNRKGELVKIIEYNGFSNYPFLGNNGISYLEYGYRYSHQKNYYDLMELIAETQTNNKAKMEKIQTIEEIDAEIKRLQELRKKLNKSVGVDDTWFDFRIQVRNAGEYSYRGFYLSRDYNWEIVNDCGDLVLVPTKK